MRRKKSHLLERHLYENCHREQKEEVNEFFKLSFVEKEKENIKLYKKFKDPTAFSDDNKESFKLSLKCNQCLTHIANGIENEANLAWSSFI